ncbi:YCF48-related protein [Zavarzinia compransoris]|uniref:WD40/YVTN/BNR-like repeat-containing protein n=1 Tax=Zavarzinia marina TaxID=2911065 RepID=UPI001F1F26D5|nr:YCF48-related protein [Zavarzinia marina]MCF4165632.1 YCF48-related protein [Zavarzinia marina]
MAAMLLAGAMMFAGGGASAGSAPAGGGYSLEAVRQGTTHEAIYCLASQGSEQIAAGVPNLLFTSKDQGATWDRVTDIQSDRALLGCVLKGPVAIVVGQMGVVLRHDADGWAHVDPGTDARLFSVDMNDSGRAIAVGAFGTILISDDAGKTWRKAEMDWSRTNDQGFEPHVYAASIDADGTMTVVGEFAMILRSTDGGANWDVVNIGEASLFDIRIDAHGVGYAVGQKGAVLRTRDNGLTWSPVESGTEANLLGIARDGKGRILVTGIRTMLQGTDDSGRMTAIDAGDVATTWYQPALAGQGGSWLVAGHTGRIVSVKHD